MKKILHDIKEWIDLTKFMVEKYGIVKGLWHSIPTPDFYYTLKAWVSPYNVIKIQTLKKTWTDRSEVLLHGAFQVLVDFVEKEMFPDSALLRKSHGVSGQIFDMLLEMNYGPFIFKLYEENKHDLDESAKSLKKSGFDDEMIKIQIDQLKEANETDLEIVQLYYWWKYIHPVREEQDPIYTVEFPKIDFVPSATHPHYLSMVEIFKDEEHEKNFKVAFKDSIEWEDACRKEEEEMLNRLIKIRAYLYT
jgi:hypothetical protein